MIYFTFNYFYFFSQLSNCLEVHQNIITSRYFNFRFSRFHLIKFYSIKSEYKMTQMQNKLYFLYYEYFKNFVVSFIQSSAFVINKEKII
jgi:hypothetical protein